jgi:TonB family protein
MRRILAHTSPAMRRLPLLLLALAALPLAAQTSQSLGPPYRVGGDVKAPVVIQRVEPEYPEEARANRVSGIVILETVIDSNGDVRDAKVLKPLPYGLDEAAAAAVKQWKFRPGTLDGIPVDTIFNLTINFKLESESSTRGAMTTVILVRHAEKGTAPANDPPLTAAGQQRAQDLARMFAKVPVTAVFTTPYARTRDTAAPLATAVGLQPVELQPNENYAREVVMRVHQGRGGTFVVVGHSNTTRDVLRAFGVDAPEIPDSEYDNLYILTFSPAAEPRLLALKY